MLVRTDGTAATTSRRELLSLLIPPTPAADGILLLHLAPVGLAGKAGGGAGIDEAGAGITGTAAAV